MRKLTIGDIAQQAGLSTSAIRYYEQEGLRPEPPRESGQRRYSADVLPRLRLIRSLRDAGFTIADLRVMLRDFPDDAPAPPRWQALSDHKLADIDAQIQQLQQMKQLLVHVQDCRCADLDVCAESLHVR